MITHAWTDGRVFVAESWDFPYTATWRKVLIRVAEGDRYGRQGFTVLGRPLPMVR